MPLPAGRLSSAHPSADSVRAWPRPRPPSPCSPSCARRSRPGRGQWKVRKGSDGGSRKGSGGRSRKGSGKGSENTRQRQRKGKWKHKAKAVSHLKGADRRAAVVLHELLHELRLRVVLESPQGKDPVLATKAAVAQGSVAPSSAAGSRSSESVPRARRLVARRSRTRPRSEGHTIRRD